MIIDYKEIDELQRYKVMSDTIVPRPIAWIVTEDNGVINAAPFSYFIPISSDPALVIVTIGKKSDGSPKDTLANILKTKMATICFVNKDNLENVKLSAKELPKEEGEIEKFEIDVEVKLEGFPPMISSTQSALFCEFYDTINIPGKSSPLILEIKKQFVQDDLVDEKMHLHLDNIGRCGVSFKAMLEL
jgi:flavin reductase (DIM6/NTAB) family NADH-FMN oxidoreductase RutF